MVIHLGTELESAWSQLAREQGVDVETLAVNALRAQFLKQNVSLQPRDEWERQLLDAATDCGVSLSNQALSRESLYA